LKSVSVDQVVVDPDSATPAVPSFLITVGCVVSVFPSLFRSTPTTGFVVPHQLEELHTYPFHNTEATALHALITPFAFTDHLSILSISSGPRPGSILSNNATTLAASGDAIEVPL